MNNWATVLWTTVLTALGVIGGLIFSSYPITGGALTLLGLVGNVVSLISAEIQSRSLQDQLDITSELLIKGGIGNLHLEKFRRELRLHGRCDRSVEYLTAAVKADPRNADANAELAAVLALTLSLAQSAGYELSPDRLRLARHAANQALRLRRGDQMACAARGIICDLEGQHSAARTWFRKTKDKGNHLWKVQCCTSYLMEGKFADALKEIEEVIAEGKYSGWVVPFYYGRCLNAVGRYRDALPYLMRAFVLRGIRHELMQEIGGSLYMQGRFFSASAYAALEGLALWSGNKRRSLVQLKGAVVLAASCAILRASRLVLPIARHSSFLRRLQDKYLPPYEPDAHVAFEALKIGAIPEGHALVDQALKAMPDFPAFWYYKAEFLAADKRYDEALAAYDLALAHEPSNEVWLHNRNRIVQVKAGKIKLGRMVFVDAILQPDGTHIFENLRPLNDSPQKKRRKQRE